MSFFFRLPVCLWAAAVLWLWLWPALSEAQSAGPNRLLSISLDETPDFTRLSFRFQNPLESYQLRRDDADRLLLDLGPAAVAASLSAPEGPLVAQIDLEEKGGRLSAAVRLNALRYEVRHQVSPDRLTLAVDVKNQADSAAPAEAAAEEMKPLEPPPLAEVARRLSLATPPQPGDGPAENLYQRVLGRLMIADYPGAMDDIQFFTERFPTHPSLEYLSYLKPEAEFLAGTPADTYARAVQGWQSALERWPQSLMAIRARFLLAEADRRMGYYNEAAAKFKLLADDRAGGEDLIYSQLAFLRTADLLLNMGLIDEARALLDPVLQEGRPGRLGVEAYARSGMADFYQGYFSQANEIFREALRLLPGLYQTYPDLLYGMGEGYHYLDRPDLSTEYLYQALNLMPEHPNADVIMARIGDNYRKEGRDREAMAVYGAASRSYPNGDGGLISQVRLADMGALHSFFSQDRVFDVLERGSRQATVEMYKKIVESGSNSPLLQLAQLKIGTALDEDGENAEAVKWLRDLEINNPRSTLLPAALPSLNRALVEEITLREELSDWSAIADLYADNSSYLADEDRPAVLRIAARAFEELGRYGEARDIWRELQEEEPARRLARARALVINSLKMGQPLEALNYLVEMAKEFPEQKEWMDLQMIQTGRALARPGGAQATENLLSLVAATDSEPARREALADAIEIEINERRYESAMKLMDRYRREYPEDELTPEYILTQAKIEDYEKRYERAWDLQSEFRLAYPGDPRGPELLKEQIARADALGRPDDTLRFMELYRLSYPQNTDSRTLLIEKMQREWDLGRYQDSQRSLAAYRRDYPQDEAIIQLLIDRSRQDWNKGRYEAAQWAVEELLERYAADPRVFDFLAGRAQDDWRGERYDAAQWMVNALLRHYPQEAQVGGLMLKLAADDWGRGRFEPARRGWETFRQAFPEDPRVDPSYFEQYQKSVAAGQTDAAFALADEFRRQRPLESAVQADLMLEEAKDYLALGRNEEALSMWDRFRQTFPEDPRIPGLLLVQARQEVKLGRVDQALNHYRAIIERHPESPLVPDVYLELAAAEIRAGQRLPAWERLDRYRNLFSNHAGRSQALLDQAELGRQIGRPEEAAELYRVFRQDYPADPQVPSTFLAQARLEISAANSEGAIATLEEGLLTAPPLDADANVQALLTDLYLETGRVEDWAAIVERNLDRAENPGADLEGRFLKYNQLGQVYQELSRPADAERNFDKALENRPAGVSPETLYALATSYKNMMRPEKYVQTLRLVLDSGDPFWRKIAEDELAQQVQPSPTTGP